MEGFPPSSTALWPAVVDRRFGSKFYVLRGEAICYVLLSFVEHLKPEKVKTFTHNLSAARIASVGSFKVHVQSVALSIFCFCLSHGIALVAQWIPSSLDGRANLLRRFVDKYDWRVYLTCFDWLMPNGVPTRTTVLLPITVAPRYNEPRYNEDPVITKNI